MNLTFTHVKLIGGVGSVVDLELDESVVPNTSITKSVILEFSTESVIRHWNFSEFSEEVDTNQPLPFWTSPFLLLLEENLEKTEVRSSNFKWKSNNPVEKLPRKGRHPLLHSN